MAKEGENFSDESWSFALRLYAESGVAEACLRLQSIAGVDVMMLLAVLFAASQKNIPLSFHDVKALDAVVQPWREQVVHPLRALRTALKSGPAPAPSSETDKLRSRIKADELHAEQIENDLLGNWLQHKTRAPAALTRHRIYDILADVVRCFGADPSTIEVSAAIDVILGATARVSA